MITIVSEGTELVLEQELKVEELIWLHHIVGLGELTLRPGFHRNSVSDALLNSCRILLLNTDTSMGCDLSRSFKVFQTPQEYYNWLVYNLPRGLETVFFSLNFPVNRLLEVGTALANTNHPRFIELSNGLKTRFVTL